MPDVAEFDRMFRAVEMTLVPQVPKDVRMRIQTARNLGVYAGFSYDLSAVSAYWSITCIEMALWNRSQEIDPSVHNTIVITKFHLEVITRSVRLNVGSTEFSGLGFLRLGSPPSPKQHLRQTRRGSRSHRAEAEKMR